MDKFKELSEWFVTYTEALAPEELVKQAEAKGVTIRDALTLGHGAALIAVAAKLQELKKKERAWDVERLARLAYNAAVNSEEDGFWDTGLDESDREEWRRAVVTVLREVGL